MQKKARAFSSLKKGIFLFSGRRVVAASVCSRKYAQFGNFVGIDGI